MCHVERAVDVTVVAESYSSQGVVTMAAQGTLNYVYFVDQQLGLGASGNVYLGRHKVMLRPHHTFLSFTHPLIHSFSHSFIHSFICLYDIAARLFTSLFSQCFSVLVDKNTIGDAGGQKEGAQIGVGVRGGEWVR